MKKLLLLIILFSGIILNSKAQDKITTKKGDIIECRITNVDSIKVYFTLKVKGQEVNTFLNKADITSFKYEKEVIEEMNLVAEKDSISLEKTGEKIQYIMYGKRLKSDNLAAALKVNPMALQKYEKAKSRSEIAVFLGCLGGALIGYPIGAAIAGEKPNWIISAAGVGFLVVSFPVLRSSEKQIKEAVELYNRGLKRSSMIKSEVKLGFTGSGLGLCLSF